MEKQNKELTSNARNEDVFEEDIYIENRGILRYSLSNDINKIKVAIYKHTGNDDFSFINEYGWRLNTNLSNNVKLVMNKYDVNYSMTYYSKDGIQFLVINKREGNRWYISCRELEYKKESEKPFNEQLYDDPVFSDYKEKSREKPSGFGSAFAGSFIGSLTGGLLNAVLNAGGISPIKKRKF